MVGLTIKPMKLGIKARISSSWNYEAIVSRAYRWRKVQGISVASKPIMLRGLLFRVSHFLTFWIICCTCKLKAAYVFLVR